MITPELVDTKLKHSGLDEFMTKVARDAIFNADGTLDAQLSEASLDRVIDNARVRAVQTGRAVGVKGVKPMVIEEKKTQPNPDQDWDTWDKLTRVGLEEEYSLFEVEYEHNSASCDLVERCFVAVPIVAADQMDIIEKILTQRKDCIFIYKIQKVHDDLLIDLSSSETDALALMQRDELRQFQQSARDNETHERFGIKIDRTPTRAERLTLRTGA